MFDLLTLSIDPNSSSLLAYILAGATSITATLFASMIQAKNAQIKEKDNTLNKVVEAKNHTINDYTKLLAEIKKDNENLHAQNVQLLSQVLPALKTTQEILKDLSAAFREISRK